MPSITKTSEVKPTRVRDGWALPIRLTPGDENSDARNRTADPTGEEAVMAWLHPHASMLPVWTIHLLEALLLAHSRQDVETNRTFSTLLMAGSGRPSEEDRVSQSATDFESWIWTLFRGNKASHEQSHQINPAGSRTLGTELSKEAFRNSEVKTRGTRTVV